MSCRQYNATEVDELLNSSITLNNEKEFLRNLQLIPCQMGWIYENSTYIDTLVTEVGFPKKIKTDEERGQIYDFCNMNYHR